MNAPMKMNVRQHKRRLAITCLLLFAAILQPFAVQAAISTRIDRDTVKEGETFTLVLSASDGSSSEQPDVAPLNNDFDVLGTSQNSQFQIINGRSSSTHSWNITLSPRHTGKIVIPPLTIGNDHSTAVNVTVLSASDTTDTNSQGEEQGDVFIEVDAKPQSAYVQAQVLYTVRLYYAVPVRQGNLSEPTLANAIVQKLGEDSDFETQQGGRHYQVVERRYALFPQKSGGLEIPAIVFDGIVSTSRGGVDPYGNALLNAFNQSAQQVRLRSRSLHIEVAPQPSDYKGTNWLPAQELSLTQTWSPTTPQFRVGDPVTRTLTVRAKGLSASQLPDLPTPDLPGLKVYPDQAQTRTNPSDSALVAEREQKIAMIATQAGDMTLPALRLHWWDTDTKQERIAELPAQTIHVLPALNSSSPVTPQVTQPQSNTTERMAPVTASPTTVTSPVLAATAKDRLVFTSPWPWLAGIFALAWAVTLVLWWRSDRSRRTQTESAGRFDLKEQRALKLLKIACQRNESLAAKAALLEWARTHWPNEQLNSLGAIAKLMKDSDFSAQIARLDQCLYQATALPWQGLGLWQSFEIACKQQSQVLSRSNPLSLEPLHLSS